MRMDLANDLELPFRCQTYARRHRGGRNIEAVGRGARLRAEHRHRQRHGPVGSAQKIDDAFMAALHFRSQPGLHRFKAGLGEQQLSRTWSANIASVRESEADLIARSNFSITSLSS